MHSTIWWQTLKNSIQMVGQNAVLTSKNALKWLSQESASVNPFVWHSNSYLIFNHLHGMYMLEWHVEGISWKHLNYSI